jgi:hypothetical protein
MKESIGTLEQPLFQVWETYQRFHLERPSKRYLALYFQLQIFSFPLGETKRHQKFIAVLALEIRIYILLNTPHRVQLVIWIHK